jgi:uncharacterized membrane protein
MLNLLKKIDKNQVYIALNIIMFTLVGMLWMEISKRQEAELEVQRQAEMVQIANDKLVNAEVTR